jgi:hypothetical protein
MKIALIFLSFLSFACCISNGRSFAEGAGIDLSKDPQKIEYCPSVQSSGADAPIFTITDKAEIKTAMNEIMNASNPEPWKGAGWYRIKIHYYDNTIVSLNTNNKKIGIGASGDFYSLENDNFITRRLMGNQPK